MQLFVAFQKRNDVLTSFVDGRINAAVDLFEFQSLHEAFRFGVVIGISFAAHASANVVLLQQVNVVATTILHAAIRSDESD